MKLLIHLIFSHFLVASFNESSVDALTKRYRTLFTEVHTFSASLAARIPFVSVANQQSCLGLAESDIRIRETVNTLSTSLAAALEQSEADLVLLTRASDFQAFLASLQEKFDALSRQMEGIGQGSTLETRQQYCCSCIAQIRSLYSSVEGFPLEAGHTLDSVRLQNLERDRLKAASTLRELQSAVEGNITDIEKALSATCGEKVERMRTGDELKSEAEPQPHTSTGIEATKRENEEHPQQVQSPASFQADFKTSISDFPYTRPVIATGDVFGPEAYTSETQATAIAQSAEKQSISTAEMHASRATRILVTTRESEAIGIAFLEASLLEISGSSLVAPEKYAIQSRLPNVKEAEAAQRQVSLLHAHIEDYEPKSPAEEARLEQLRLLLRSKADEAVRNVHLANFAALLGKNNDTISDLLVAIDNGEKAGILSALVSAERIFTSALDAGSAVADDSRVRTRLEQIEETWLEIRSMAEHAAEIPSLPCSSNSKSSSISSDFSIKSSARRAISNTEFYDFSPGSSKSWEATPRSQSFSSSSRIPGASPLARSVSKTSSRPASMLLSRPGRRSPGGFVAAKSPKSSGAFVSPASTPDLRRSLSSASNPTKRYSSTRRIDSSSNWKRESKPNIYQADPMRKLDIAVGDIVNNMTVRILCFVAVFRP